MPRPPISSFSVLRGAYNGRLLSRMIRTLSTRLMPGNGVGTPQRVFTSPSTDGESLGVAYLCNAYPALTHTFVAREVVALRRHGVHVSTFAIHRSDPQTLLSEMDRKEFTTTHALLPPDWLRLVTVNLRLLLTSPQAFFSTLAFAIGLQSGFRSRLWQLFYFLEATLLWRECERRGLRHIHAHIGMNAADTALLAARLGNAVAGHQRWSWSFTIHGPTEFYYVDRFNLVNKIAHARFVVCISYYTRSQLMSLSDPRHWDKMHVIRCSVDSERFRPPARSDSSEPPRILSIGRLVPEKGQAVLLDALALLRERGCEFRATIAGAGPDAEHLVHRSLELGLDRHVSFPGAIGQDEIRSYYAEASIFCVASFAEGLPGVIFEAMAMELPVVSTRITAIPELVIEGETGLLVTPARPDELADALERLLADPELRAAMGRAGREKVVREYNPETLASRLQAIFAEAAVSSRPVGVLRGSRAAGD
jgi:colanic acid/amylovoran biosynthesis glycosyltransferase